MAASNDQQTWAPYYSSRDCSLGYCTLYCPQWCYFILPPPPPPLRIPNQESSLNFSPLVIAIIGILASTFLLIIYYVLASKYCRNLDSLRGGLQQNSGEEYEDGNSPMYHEPWQVGATGLDETVIKSIAMCKYKKGDGFVEGTDCVVCLSEFREGETLRLLPKCSHAFHLHCIDAWLRSHLNCPLCRASITSGSNLLPQSLPPAPESNSSHVSSTESPGDVEAATENVHAEMRVTEETNSLSTSGSACPVRALSDLSTISSTHMVIEIEEQEEIQSIRRSVSMSRSWQCAVPRSNGLHMIYMEIDFQGRESQFASGLASVFKRCRSRFGKGYRSSSILHFVLSPTAMKRCSSSLSSRRPSFSSPRFGRRFS